MQIEFGKYYVNKTWKYLRPCLRYLGPTFVVKYNAVYKLALGIHDHVLDNTAFENQNLMFLLLDNGFNPKQFDNFLDWLMNQECYATDYNHDGIFGGRQHMVVIKIPEKALHAYNMFKESKYSQMYTREEIGEFFTNNDQREAREVLLQTMSARESFVKKVNHIFKTNLTMKDTYGGELDFPLEQQKEFFNHTGGS